jgi:hypothetical protein
LFEEVNIQIQNEEIQIATLWESVFPVRIELGNPQRHHIVIFLYTKLKTEPEIKLQASEVDYCAWLSKEDFEMIFSEKPMSDEKTFRAFNALTEFSLPLQQLQNIPHPFSGLPSAKRISTGAKYAIEWWLKQK